MEVFTGILSVVFLELTDQFPHADQVSCDIDICTSVSSSNGYFLEGPREGAVR